MPSTINVAPNSFSVNRVKVVNDQDNPVSTLNGLSIPAHDRVELTYTGQNITTVVYKSGGAGGTTVATLALTYDGNDNILTITRS